jgi:selenocysteine-specific elongation factor
VRGLQTHKKKEEFAVPGSRTAINISGVPVDQVQRGEVVAHPGDYRPDRRLDVHFRLLPDVSQPLRHNTEVKLFIGAAEEVARVRLLGSEELLPGKEGWLQLELAGPVVAIRGDRYILRRPSPGETLGGGVVVDPHPKGRHKRFSSETLAALELLAQGTPSDVLLQALLALGAAPLREVVARSNLDASASSQAVAELLASGQMLNLEFRGAEAEPAVQPNDLVTSSGLWSQLARRAIQEVQSYHEAFPLRSGMPREELKSRLKIKASPRLFNAAIARMVASGELAEAGPLVMIPGHSIRFTSQQQQKVDRLLARFAAAPYAPPSVKECQAEAGEDVTAALLELGQLILVAPDVVFRREDYDQMAAQVRQQLEKNGTLTAAQVRDYFNTSRKYVLALLEHLDATGVTLREGDVRRLRRS